MESRPVAVEHAAHIYFAERSSLLQAFIRMLHIHLGYMGTADPGCKDLVEQVLQYLTDASKGDSATKTMPLKRLCDIVKVSTLHAQQQADHLQRIATFSSCMCTFLCVWWLWNPWCKAFVKGCLPSLSLRLVHLSPEARCGLPHHTGVLHTGSHRRCP